MPRCNCAGATCGCTIKKGAGIEITGTGTVADPFLITATIAQMSDVLSFEDSATVEFEVVGDGTSSDPLVISANVLRQNFPAYTTGGRPSASVWGVGAFYYDTTVGKPAWSNGTVWKDAAGTTIT